MTPDKNRRTVIYMNDAPESIKSDNRSGKLFKILLIVFVVTLLLIGAFFAGWKIAGDSFKTKANRLNQLSNPASPMFAKLTGSIEGKVVKVEGNTIHIESSKGGKGIFNLVNPIFVKEINGDKVLDLGQSKESIKLNQEALINIVVLGFNDGYAVNSITYLNEGKVPEFNPESALIPVKSASQSAKVSKR